MNDRFGFSVALHGDSLLVGANGDAAPSRGVGADPNGTSAPYSGAAYMFARDGQTWTPTGYFKASNTDASDGFGYNVAVSATSATVSAIYEASGVGGPNADQADNSAKNAGAVSSFQ